MCGYPCKAFKEWQDVIYSQPPTTKVRGLPSEYIVKD